MSFENAKLALEIKNSSSYHLSELYYLDYVTKN